VSYEISADGKAITCHTCGLTSPHPQDVQYLYCAKCDVFHLSGRSRTEADILWIRMAEDEGIEINGYDGGFGVRKA
jgi:hypothetical protein